MADLRCSSCGRPVIPVSEDGVTTLVKGCSCTAPIVANISASLAGAGAVKGS